MKSEPEQEQQAFKPFSELRVGEIFIYSCDGVSLQEMKELLFELLANDSVKDYLIKKFVQDNKFTRHAT